MSVLLSEEDIERLVAERKPLPDNYRASIQVKPKRGHKERQLMLSGKDGDEFLLLLRQSDFNQLDFSAILCYRVADSTQLFRLRRYNGKSHEHTNKLEGYTFYDFHVHYATERYQDSGLREDSFAEPTNRYCDLTGAVSCMIEDCGFEKPFDPQQDLFEEL